MDSTQQNSLYVKLLSDPEFSFGPYFDEAVINWLTYNMSRFLKEQPKACKFFIKSQTHLDAVAGAIPIDQENIEYVTSFIKNLDTAWNGRAAFQTIAKRLVEAGFADIALMVPNINQQQIQPELINAVSEEALINMIKNTKLVDSAWTYQTYCTIIGKLPQKELRIFIDAFDHHKMNHKILAPVVSTLARWIAYSDLNDFAKKFMLQLPELKCMCCSDKVAKSRPGYTLHRKTCDPKNEYPSIYDTIATRMKYGK